MRLFYLLVLLPMVASIVIFEPRASRWTGKQLRILPLGASITHGDHSSTGNGYRDYLRTLLSPAKVTYIGTQCSGTMTNGNNEGHPGFFVGNMQSVAAPDLPYKPNIVLIFVGTNDMIFGSVATAVTAYQDLIKSLTQQLPNSLLVVGKLFLETAHAGAQANIDQFNGNLTVKNLGGYSNVVIADFSKALLASDLDDGEHPNDSGYRKMANVWSSSLNRYVSRISTPVAVSIPANYTNCNGSPST